MRLRKFFSCCIALLLCLAISAPGFSAPLTKVRTAWMDEFEAFPIWYAKEKGWDKEAGLDLEILYFTSGMAILNALPSGEWQYAAIGAVYTGETRRADWTECMFGRWRQLPGAEGY